MPTALQKTWLNKTSSALLAHELTVGNGDAYDLWMNRIQSVSNHVAILQRESLGLKPGYIPFRPRHTFEVRSRYRYAGKMPALPYRLDE